MKPPEKDIHAATAKCFLRNQWIDRCWRQFWKTGISVWRL